MIDVIRIHEDNTIEIVYQCSDELDHLFEKEIIIEQNRNISQITEEDIKEFYIQALKLEPQMLIDYLRTLV